MSAWQEKCLTVARDTKTGAILRAALNRNEAGAPTFGSHASITSDGFLIADFTSMHGDFHMGAFVGSYDELAENICSLAKHCKLTKSERAELDAAVSKWCGAGTSADYRRFAS